MTPPPWAAFLIESHALAAYLLAVTFPLWRWIRRANGGHKMSFESVIHQAATGFVLPSFIMLCFSYLHPALSEELSGHELGIAGLYAVIIALRELCVDGVESRANYLD